MRLPERRGGGPEIQALLRQLEIQLKDAWTMSAYIPVKRSIESAQYTVRELRSALERDS